MSRWLYPAVAATGVAAGLAISIDLSAQSNEVDWVDKQQETKPVVDGADAINAGRRLYRQICIVCHLKAGGRGPKLFQTKIERQRFLEIVMNGRDDTQMPSFRDRLSEYEVRQLYAFVLSRERY